MRDRIIQTTLLLFTAFLLLGSKVTYLQVYKSNYLKSIFHKQFQKVEDIEPIRGYIYDCNGTILALSTLNDSYYCMPQDLESIETTADMLSNLLDLEKESLLKKLRDRTGFFWIKRKAAIDDSRSLLSKRLSKGIGIIKEAKRFYPRKDFACHVIGITGLDNHGLSGTEYKLDSYLRASSKQLRISKDALGRDVVTSDTLSIEENTASNVYLTIDEVIQHSAEKHADTLFKKTKSKAVSIVVQKVETGEILALVNRPSFDGNAITKDDLKVLKNRVVTDVYEPGSTLKVCVAAAAIEEKVVGLNTKLFCENGKYKIGTFSIEDHDKYGTLDVRDIIAHSSNIGMAKIGQRLGKDKLYEWLKSFGFGNYTGIELPGEVKGILRHPKEWSTISASVIAFGQEIGVTSIQTVCAYSCIANNGILLEPRIIKSVRNFENEKTTLYKKRVVRKVISADTCRKIIEAMEQVVIKGTAASVQYDGYRIACKTGTAQKIDPKTGKYSNKKYIASIAGFFPAQKPEVTILVMADEPKGIYWGGDVCGPIFKALVKDIALDMNIPKSLNRGIE
ncbi:peptidoglycan D,D-transpeptidase FtsI family protein [bacterium]